MDDAGGLTPLLIDAKREYVGQLTDVLAPYVVNHMVALYMAAQKQSPKAVTLAFQNALRAIPLWNSNTVQQHTGQVQSKYAFLGDLIAACFVAYVKILSSVKLHQQKPNIRLKLPTNDAFVHKVFINSAREFYTNPSLLRADRGTKVGVVRAAVEAAVRDMLPIEDILKAYLGNTVDAEENSVVPSEFLDDDVYNAPAPAAAPAPTPAPQEPVVPLQHAETYPEDLHPHPHPPEGLGGQQPPPEPLYDAEPEDEFKHVSLQGPPPPAYTQPAPAPQQAPPPPLAAPAPLASMPRSQPIPVPQPRPMFSDADDE